jgi:pyruvate dehydrogenase E2 component (dihydrolipoamide acetyltransferase)
VPVIHDADTLSLRDLASVRADLVEAARAGRLTPSQLDGGTFSVSNLGMFGIDEFHAIINPPQSGILAVGRAEERLALEAGDVVARRLLRVSLSADHRVFSGAAGAAFLADVRQGLEHPIALLAGSPNTQRRV